MGIHLVKIAAITAALTLAVFAPARADVLELTNGETRAGLVEDVPGQPDYLLLTDSVGQLKIERSRVKRVQSEPKAQSLCRIGTQYFTKKPPMVPEALAFYKRAAEADPQSKDAKAGILAAEAELKKKSNAENREKSLQISEALRAAREAIDAKNFEEANKKLGAVTALKPDETQAAELRNVRGNLYMEWGRDLLDKQDRNGAGEKFEAVLLMSPENLQAKNELIRLWQNDSGRADKVRSMLESISKNNPEDFPTVKMLADLDFRDRSYEKAMPLYTKLYNSNNYKGTEVETRLRTCIETLRDENASKGNLKEAIKLEKSLMEQFPETDGSRLEDYDFRLRQSGLKPGDEAGYLELAKWAKGKGRDKDAIKLYEGALDINPESPEALPALEAYAQVALAEAMDHFNKGEYDLARALFEQLRRDFPRSPKAADKALEWLDKTIIALQAQKRRDEDRAKDLITSGDLYYSQAVSSLNSVAQLPEGNNAYARKEVPSISNPRYEAKKNFQLAIQAYSQAVKLGPSLPEVVSGSVRVKLKDAQDKLYALENPVNYGMTHIPRR